MALKRHSNLLQNPNTHHLYGIYDFEKRVFYKFGISDKPVINHTSSRLSGQIALFNRVAGKNRFAGRILIRQIEGRRKARELEDTAILKFKSKYGSYPRGNPNHQFLRP